MYKLEVHLEKELVVVQFSGQVSAEEVLRCIAEFRQVDGYHKNFTGVADFRAVEIQFGPEGVKAISDFSKGRTAMRGRWCLLADKPFETAMSAIFKSKVAEQQPLEVFSTIRAASDYLGIDLTDLLVAGPRD